MTTLRYGHFHPIHHAHGAVDLEVPKGVLNPYLCTTSFGGRDYNQLRWPFVFRIEMSRPLAWHNAHLLADYLRGVADELDRMRRRSIEADLDAADELRELIGEDAP